MKGFKQTDFMSALHYWDNNLRKVVCIYRQTKYEFNENLEYQHDFKVHGGMILEGMWYVEE